jgi:hypothetical protein
MYEDFVFSDTSAKNLKVCGAKSRLLGNRIEEILTNFSQSRKYCQNHSTVAEKFTGS